MMKNKLAVLILSLFLAICCGCSNGSSSGDAEPTPLQQVQPLSIKITGRFPLESCLSTLDRSYGWGGGNGSLTYYLVDYDCYLTNLAPAGNEITSATITGALDLGKDMEDLYGKDSIHITAEIPYYDKTVVRVKYFWGANNIDEGKQDAANRLSNASLAISYQKK